MNDKDIVYVVINYGEPIYASREQSDAENFADGKNFNAREDVLNEWDIDDPDFTDLDDAEIQAGIDGDFYEVFFFDISKYNKGDQIELDDGTEIDYDDVIDLLKKNDSDEFFYNEDMDYWTE